MIDAGKASGAEQPAKVEAGPGIDATFFGQGISIHALPELVFAHPPPARPWFHMRLFSEFRAGQFSPVNLGNPASNLKNFAPRIFGLFAEGVVR